MIRPLAAGSLIFGAVGLSLFAAPASLPVNPQPAWDPAVDDLAAQPYAAGEAAPAGAAAGGRTRVRTLFSFEDSTAFDIDGKPVPYLMQHSEETDIAYVRDNGVTDGLWCARCTVAPGKPWGTIVVKDPKALAGWSDYDYFALDLYVDDDHPYPVSFELLDAASRNYATRCTFEGTTTRRGRQTLMWPINRCRRNGKEGRGWEELEPKDKIDMKGLTTFKLIVTPRPDRRLQFWIDNIRLLQEDAAVPRLRVALPKGARAYDFGSPGSCVPGFAPVPAAAAYAPARGFGFVSPKDLSEGGKGWPDPLSGTFVIGGHNVPVEFRADVPPGEYRYWICAGPVIPSDWREPVYRLAVNGAALRDDKPSFEAFDGSAYVHRFLWTQYSERPHAVWLDYIDRMYPTYAGTVSAGDGRVTVTAVNHFLSALILVPAADAADFDRMAARLRKVRRDAFEAAAPPAPAPPKPAGEGDYLLYVPDADAPGGPASGPRSDAERARRSIAATAARGQNVFLRVAVTPFKDLGACELKLADLAGPAGAIPASAIRGHFQNYRFGPRGASEMILLPALTLRGEAGITQHFWLWLVVPADAAPGAYRGTFTFAPANAAPAALPVEIAVLPFALDRDVPASLGLYGGAGGRPEPPREAYLAGMRKRYEWMRGAGFTGTGGGPAAQVTGVDAAAGTAVLRFDDALVGPAMAAGLGVKPGQQNMVTQLGIARAISRQLQPAGGSAGGAPVDRNPGVEFDHPRFKACWTDAMRQYKKHLEQLGMAYAIEIVDEPREVPNPWNRNLQHTCRYGDWMAEAGFATRFVTPMGDRGGNDLDYTELANHADIVSIHAGAGSAGLMRKTLAAGKTLWFYNTGMSRYLWGAYPWRCGAKGRWEWHWCSPDGEAVGGYPGGEWYNPFTPMDGYTCAAPWAAHPGGFLYKTDLLTAADGITDFAYLHMLEKAARAARAAGAKADAAAKAEALLAEIRRAVPELPNDEASRAAGRQLDAWRARAGALIADLSR